MAHAPVGMHCILELHGCRTELLDNETFLRRALTEASRHGMSTLLKLGSHKFDPQGVTAFALLAESHLSIHTWPESGYAAVDAFTCGDTANPRKACEYLVEALEATAHSLTVLPRGGEPAEYSASYAPAGEEREEVGLCQAQN